MSQVASAITSQQALDRRESFQYAHKPRLDHEYSSFHQQLDAAPRTSNDAITPPNFDSAILAGFRKEYRSDATATAEKTLAAGALATDTILQMAGWIQDIKSRLKRKEFSAFVKELLQWVGDEARKYLDIARTFKDFDLTRLQKLEPFTLLKLRSKRYLPVVDSLRDVPVITPKLVQDLIKESRTKQSRKKQDEPLSGWKQSRSEGGRYYKVLLHDETTGLSIEQQAKESGILPQRVIAEAVALLSQHKSSSSVQVNEYTAAQLEELKDVVEHARSLDTENRKLMYELQQQERRIADLEAKLAESVTVSSEEVGIVHKHAQPRTEQVEELAPTASVFVESQQPVDDAMPHESSEAVDEVTIAQREVEQYLEEQAAMIAVLPEGSVLAGEDETEIQWLLNAPIHSVEAVIRSTPVRSAYRALYLLNQFQSNDAKRMEVLEERVTEHHIAIGAVPPAQAIASEQIAEYSPQETEVTDCLEAEQESKYLQPVEEDILLSADEVSVSDREESLAAQYVKEGDLVEINVTRGNNDKTWNGLRGYIQKFVASTGKAVVLLQGDYRSKQFFKDELKLVSPVDEKSQASVVASGSEECLPSTEAEPRVFQEGDRVEIVSSRQGDDLVWQVGVVDVANTVGCVVKVAGQIRWFCNDELLLVPAAPQTAPVQEKNVTPSVQPDGRWSYSAFPQGARGAAANWKAVQARGGMNLKSAGTGTTSMEEWRRISAEQKQLTAATPDDDF